MNANDARNGAFSHTFQAGTGNGDALAAGTADGDAHRNKRAIRYDELVERCFSSNDACVPLLLNINWNDEWKRIQKTRNTPDDSSAWDARAESFPTAHGTHSTYASTFIAYSDIHARDTVFDMGCGTGVLALPLAHMGVDVLAADFSRGMLSVMEKSLNLHHIPFSHASTAREFIASHASTARAANNASNTRTGSVDIMQLSWDDAWSDAGFQPNMVDVAVASRSIATSDLGESILRLSMVARRHACITLAREVSPRIDRRLMETLQLPMVVGRDFYYAFMILAGYGFTPEVRYIPAGRHDYFDTLDEAHEFYERLIVGSLKNFVDAATLARAIQRLHAWVDSEIVENPQQCEDTPQALRTREKRDVQWAHIRWDTSSFPAQL